MLKEKLGGREGGECIVPEAAICCQILICLQFMVGEIKSLQAEVCCLFKLRKSRSEF